MGLAGEVPCTEMAGGFPLLRGTEGHFQERGLDRKAHDGFSGTSLPGPVAGKGTDLEV